MRRHDEGSSERPGEKSNGRSAASAAPAEGLYEHYKGGRYQVLGLARHSETEEPLVLYRALYGERGLWVRPLAMFTGSVTIDGETRQRFRRLGDDDPARD